MLEYNFTIIGIFVSECTKTNLVFDIFLSNRCKLATAADERSEEQGVVSFTSPRSHTHTFIEGSGSPFLQHRL